MLEQREACKVIKEHFKDRTDTIIGCELGVALGSHAESLLHNIPNLHLYLVDNDYIGGYEVTPGAGYEACIKKGGKFSLGHIIRDVPKDKITWNIKRTEDAVRDYEDNFFDFVYVDADHNYVNVKKDCELWWPKVKPGGIICGHDYGEPSNMGVTDAVEEVFRDKKLIVYKSANVDDGVKDQRYIQDWWVFKNA